MPNQEITIQRDSTDSNGNTSKIAILIKTKGNTKYESILSDLIHELIENMNEVRPNLHLDFIDETIKMADLVFGQTIDPVAEPIPEPALKTHTIPLRSFSPNDLFLGPLTLESTAQYSDYDIIFFKGGILSFVSAIVENDDESATKIYEHVASHIKCDSVKLCEQILRISLNKIGVPRFQAFVGALIDFHPTFKEFVEGGTNNSIIDLLLEYSSAYKTEFKFLIRRGSMMKVNPDIFLALKIIRESLYGIIRLLIGNIRSYINPVRVDNVSFFIGVAKAIVDNEILTIDEKNRLLRILA